MDSYHCAIFSHINDGLLSAAFETEHGEQSVQHTVEDYKLWLCLNFDVFRHPACNRTKISTKCLVSNLETRFERNSLKNLESENWENKARKIKNNFVSLFIS